MRLDKYLKVSRIIKRRPVAKEVADKGRIKVNGVLAKSSTDLKIGDQVEVRFGNKLLTVRVLEMKEVLSLQKDYDKLSDQTKERKDLAKKLKDDAFAEKYARAKYYYSREGESIYPVPSLLP